MQTYDSKYCFLVDDALLMHHSVDLSKYRIPGFSIEMLGSDREAYKSIEFYQLTRIGNRVLYLYPYGSSILSLPFVAAMREAGTSVAPHGDYSFAVEAAMQLTFASLLMGLLACVLLAAAETMLPVAWSIAVALGASFGTQIWSSASRALWSHTWEILITGLVILALLNHAVCGRRLRPVWIATLVSWAFYVRPTGAFEVVAISVYFWIYCRRDFLAFAATGLFWAAAFVALSWSIFGTAIPPYYDLGYFFTRTNFLIVLAGILISPSRGLFVFVPVLAFVIWLTARYWRSLPCRPLAALAIAIISSNLLVITMDYRWWGGHSYGPRLETDLVPWFALLAILGIRALLNDTLRSRIAIPVACILLAASVGINGWGAISAAPYLWTASPNNIDEHPERIWDWKSPQFLAGLVVDPRR
ncbi:MAG TPA: hypothetical protein VNF29_06100 [Candidatus Binataceae bacterium]|nr:hypothetical protein [Candidatus Binataceae bacterium]